MRWISKSQSLSSNFDTHATQPKLGFNTANGQSQLIDGNVLKK